MNTNKIGAHSSEDLVWGLRLGIGNVLANAGDGLPTGKPGKNFMLLQSVPGSLCSKRAF